MVYSRIVIRANLKKTGKLLYRIYSNDLVMPALEFIKTFKFWGKGVKLFDEAVEEIE